MATPLGPLVPAPDGRTRTARAERAPNRARDKRLASLDAIFDAAGLRDGMTISFHHHYRNGDRLVNAVCEAAALRGLRGLTVAASSLFPVHAPLVRLIEQGVIAHVISDYIKGPVADAVLAGALAGPVVLQTHGGRARALASGELTVDLAFVGASLARADGAATGRAGAVPCGPIGYARVDAGHARHTAVLADTITGAPLPLVCIPPDLVDWVAEFPRPGDPAGILSGATLPDTSPEADRIGALVAEVIAAAGALRAGMSVQTGAGGLSLNAVGHLGQRMARDGLRGSFLSGGITGAHVALLEAGLFDEIRDVQCFDGAAVASSMRNPAHRMMSAADYASPLCPDAAVNALDVVLLGAAEIDRAFNVNVTIGGDGRLVGGPGGHPDTAEGAALVMITTRLVGGGHAKLVGEVAAITTPGAHVDLVVTDAGIAVNPARPALAERLSRAGLPVRGFEDLRRLAEARATRSAAKARPAERPRLLIESRHGGILAAI